MVPGLFHFGQFLSMALCTCSAAYEAGSEVHDHEKKRFQGASTMCWDAKEPDLVNQGFDTGT